MLTSTYKHWLLLFLFILIGSLPPILVGIGGLSYSIGVTVINFTLLLLSFRSFKKIEKIKSKTVIIFFSVIIYLLVQHFFVGLWSTKSYFSLLPLALLLIAAYYCSFEINRFDAKCIQRAIHHAFWTLSAIGIINILLNFTIGQYFGYINGKPMFPFLEPSHFALFYGLFFFAYFSVCGSNSKKIIATSIVLLISATTPSTTSLAYAILAIAILVISIRGKSRIFLFPPLVASAIFSLGFIVSNSYFLDRLNFTGTVNNATTLVYLQGIDDAKNSLHLTKGIGLGFQMLGTQPPSAYADEISILLGSTDGELNRQDGGFLAAKLISELGYFGALLIFFYLIMFFHAIVRVINYSPLCKDERYHKEAVASGVVIAFSVEIFGRGIGYFSPGVLIFLIALFYLPKFNKKLSGSRRQYRMPRPPQITISHQDKNFNNQ